MKYERKTFPVFLTQILTGAGIVAPAREVTFALLYMVGIISAEIITALVSPQGGIVFHAVLLSLLILHASLFPGQYNRKLLLSLALAPLTRILSLAMPLSGLPQIYWYPIIYAPLLAASIVVMRNLNYGFQEVGVAWRKIRLQLLVGLTGVGFGFIEYHILRPEPLISDLAVSQLLLPAFVLVVGTGFVEELIFRGVLQRAFGESLGVWGLVYVSFLFAVLHIGHLSALDVGFVFVIALFFSWTVKKTGSLLGATLSHGITNIFLFLVFPFLL